MINFSFIIKPLSKWYFMLIVVYFDSFYNNFVVMPYCQTKIKRRCINFVLIQFLRISYFLNKQREKCNDLSQLIKSLFLNLSINQIIKMRERQGSRGHLGQFRSLQGNFKSEHALEPSFSRRPIEEHHLGSLKGSSSTPQHLVRVSSIPDSPKLHPSQALKDILGSEPKLTHEPTTNLKSRYSRDEDSMISNTDIFRESDLTNLKGWTPSSNASRHDAVDTTRVDHKEDQLRYECHRLRQENQALRRDLSLARQQIHALHSFKTTFEKTVSEKQDAERQRERMGRRLSDVQSKCDMMQKESVLYREIISQNEKRVAVLLAENSQLQESVRKSMKKLEEFDGLQERLDKLRTQYKELERAVQQDTDEWDIAKDLWMNEREYYKEIIRKLQFQLNSRET